MITRFRLENFKGHRDTDLALQPFTLLVGDNGSGKTSVLEALQVPGNLADDLRTAETSKDWSLRGTSVQELLRWGAEEMCLSFEGQMLDRQPWTSSVKFGPSGDSKGDWDMAVTAALGEQTFHITNHSEDPEQLGRLVTLLMGPPTFYRFQADLVAASAYSDRPGASVGKDGAQTAVALAALKLADDEAFDRIEAAMRRIVPSLHRLRIRPAEVLHPSNPNPVVGSKLYFDFQGARNVPAHHASQGTLVVLALLTVLHSHDRPQTILLDDFDHALHPRAQIELVRMIKDLLALDEFKDTQIIATTHSPYVLDEVSPSNVIAFALRDDGTVASKPLSEHPDAPKVNGALKAGELWSLDPSVA
jgi:predicted ATPase